MHDWTYRTSEQLDHVNLSIAALSQFGLQKLDPALDAWFHLLHGFLTE
jgi:hypothetical protein